MEKNLADEGQRIIMNPPPHIVTATECAVAQIANGGLEIPEKHKSIAQQQQDSAKASIMVKNAHKDSGGMRM
eukprot:11795906-Karenia_brevis.AAC.1